MELRLEIVARWLLECAVVEVVIAQCHSSGLQAETPP
jgi:hypothetical protein